MSDRDTVDALRALEVQAKKTNRLLQDIVDLLNNLDASVNAVGDKLDKDDTK